MQRIRLIKNHKGYRKGEIVVVDNNEAFGLIDAGKAIITKDITESDEEQADGKSTKLRTYKLK